MLKKPARLAGREAAPGIDIHNPHLFPPSINKLFPISGPKRLVAPFVRYLALHAGAGERLNIDFSAL